MTLLTVMNPRLAHLPFVLLLLALLALTPGSRGVAETANDCDAERNAWIDGRLGATLLLNTYLNPVGLQWSTEDCVVYLEGQVESEIEHQLVSRLVEGIAGVRNVEDGIRVTQAAVSPEAQQLISEQLAFRGWVNDATLTAQVQYKLSTNRSLNADNIEVETDDSVVVLRGEVPGISDRSMAEAVTRNTEGVEAVRNLLDVAN